MTAIENSISRNILFLRYIIDINGDDCRLLARPDLKFLIWGSWVRIPPGTLIFSKVYLEFSSADFAGPALAAPPTDPLAELGGLFARLDQTTPHASFSPSSQPYARAGARRNPLCQFRGNACGSPTPVEAPDTLEF